MNKNRNHPELRDGEVFLGNSTEDDFMNRIGYQSKRMGTTAYTIHGQEIPHFKLTPSLYPVFVERQEVIRLGLDPEKFNE